MQLFVARWILTIKFLGLSFFIMRQWVYRGDMLYVFLYKVTFDEKEEKEY